MRSVRSTLGVIAGVMACRLDGDLGGVDIEVGLERRHRSEQAILLFRPVRG